MKVVKIAESSRVCFSLTSCESSAIKTKLSSPKDRDKTGKGKKPSMSQDFFLLLLLPCDAIEVSQFGWLDTQAIERWRCPKSIS